MKLMTKGIEKKFEKFPLYSQDDRGKDSTVVVKYFNPYGIGTWLITEANKLDNGDWEMFGYCHLYEWEWGYVMLSELQGLRVPPFGKIFKDKYECQLYEDRLIGLGIERDLHIRENAKVKDLI